MDHPAVEIRLPFDGEHHRLTVPPETTHFYWGSFAVGLPNVPPSSIHDKFNATQTRFLTDVRDRVSCSLTIDENTKYLVEEIRRTGDRPEQALWLATDPPNLPVSGTVTLTTTGDPPTIKDEPVVLWTQNNEIVSWAESTHTTFTLVPNAETPPMRTDGLWDRHDVYIPRPAPSS